MKSNILFFRGRSAAFVASLGLALLLCAASGSAQKLAHRGPDGEWHVTEAKEWPAPKPDASRERTVVRGMTFNVVYDDPAGVGFNDPVLGPTRKATVNAVLAYIGSVLNVNGAMDVQFYASQSDGSGFLASAGPLIPLANGFQSGLPFVHLTTGVDNYPSNPDMTCTVDFGYNWNSGTGAPLSNQFDLYSVLLHEMTHGLGILSLTTSTGASQFFASNSVHTFTTWDNLLYRRTGNLKLWSGSTPVFNGVAADLTSNDICFVGAQATAAYAAQGGSGYPPIYSPATFASGSSISHWASSISQAVMVYSVAPGAQKRTYAPVEIGALKDLGYTQASSVEAWQAY